MKVLYAIDTDRIPGVVDYYYELPTFPTCPADRGMPKPEMLNEEFELKGHPRGCGITIGAAVLSPLGMEMSLEKGSRTRTGTMSILRALLAKRWPSSSTERFGRL